MKKIMFLMVFMAIILFGNTGKAEAAIKVEDFIKYIVKEMKWKIDKNSTQPYIEAAIEKGILKKGDFKDYSLPLTRTDCAVIANRLDELVHLKYGYPEDVFDFLKDCKVWNNKLYYDPDGKYFPKGEDGVTYPADRFHEEVVMPILGEYFKNDTWKEQGLRTGYEETVYHEGKALKKHIMIGLKPIDKYLFLEIYPLDENSEVLKAWSIIHDHVRKENFVLEKRISDIKDIPKAKREAVASIVAKGIIKGFSNGLYTQDREFRGKNNITSKGAKEVIQLVLNPEKRAKISPDGQLIRTTNLPKNASDYEYILDSFPNEYYEMKYVFMFLSDYIKGTMRRDEYAYPKEVDYRFLFDNFYYNKMFLEAGKYGHYDSMLSNVEKYLKHVFSVDYRTVNNKWKEGLASSLAFHSQHKWVYNDIDNYIKNMKNHHTVIELDKVAIDSGAVYVSRKVIFVRAAVTYRITADNVSVPIDEILYGEYNNIIGLKNGEWRTDIFEILIYVINEDYDIYKWGPKAHNILSNWAYKESFK